MLNKKVEWLKSHGTGIKAMKMTLRDGTLIKKVHCIILAPKVGDEVENQRVKLNAESGVKMSANAIYGNDAISLLGGLGQIMPWLVRPQKPDVTAQVKQ